MGASQFVSLSPEEIAQYEALAREEAKLLELVESASAHAVYDGGERVSDPRAMRVVRGDRPMRVVMRVNGSSRTVRGVWNSSRARRLAADCAERAVHLCGVPGLDDVINTVRLYADGRASEEDLKAAHEAAQRVVDQYEYFTDQREAAEAVAYACTPPGDESYARRACTKAEATYPVSEVDAEVMWQQRRVIQYLVVSRPPAPDLPAARDPSPGRTPRLHLGGASSSSSPSIRSSQGGRWGGGSSGGK